MRVGQSKPIPVGAPLSPLIVFHGDADATVNYACARTLTNGFHASGPTRKVASDLNNARRYTVQQLKSADTIASDDRLMALKAAFGAQQPLERPTDVLDEGLQMADLLRR